MDPGGAMPGGGDKSLLDQATEAAGGLYQQAGQTTSDVYKSASQTAADTYHSILGKVRPGFPQPGVGAGQGTKGKLRGEGGGCGANRSYGTGRRCCPGGWGRRRFA